jgi:hypothetical protein
MRYTDSTVGRRWTRASLALLWAGVAAVGLTARAETSGGKTLGSTEGLAPGGESTVDLSNGAFKYAIDLETPDFRDLEPALSLQYDSSKGNSIAGVGWSLAGFSVIERRGGAAGGTRRCTASDVFFLDGVPLVPCTTLGGTHCAKAQSYERISYNSSADGWTVWDKDGTKVTYTSLAAPATGSCSGRYGIASAEDRKGNQVTYGWRVDSNAGGTSIRPAWPTTA